MNYIAKQDGFIGGFRCRKGDIFAYEGKPGKWMEPVKDQELVKERTAKEKGKKTEPQTFSELAHQDSVALSTGKKIN
jgi:hypothetical protein